MRRLTGGILVAIAASLAEAQGLELKLEPVGGIYGMFQGSAPGERPEPVTLRLRLRGAQTGPARSRVELSAEDIFGRPVPWRKELDLDLPPGGGSVEKDLAFDAGLGFFRVTAQASCGTAKGSATAEFGVIPPYHKGVRKDSFFASNTSNIRRGDELRLLQAIGMKVQRTHFQPPVTGGALGRPPTGAPLPLDFSGQDAAFAECRSRDTWVLPLTGYAFGGDAGKTELARKTGMHGPPRDLKEFTSTWEQIIRHYPEITTYEVWNEPWIFGWTWAAPPEEYRKMQKMWCEMALRVNPGLRIVAGNSSMFAQDHIEHDPSSWKGLIHGTTHHPYSYSTHLPTFRAGDVVRSIDDGMLLTRRMKLPWYYLTEGGTWFRPENSLENAIKIVQYHVQTALTGCFQCNAQWGIGYGPGWTRSNTAYAFMTHMLEDRPVVAEIWPENELIWGAIFANPRHVTSDVRRLPRAGELSSRWEVPVPQERSGDRTKVAVLWSWTGPSNSAQDKEGRLVIEDARHLKAYDLQGREIAPEGGRLVLPFGEAPVYVATESLGVVELRRLIAGARIEGVTPLNMYALSLREDAEKPQKLSVRVENQMNVPVRGTLRLELAGKAAASAPFRIPAARLARIELDWPGVERSPHNQYAIRLVAESEAEEDRGRSRPLAPVTREQLVQVARFARRTIRPSGSLEAWKDLTPVVLDSKLLSGGVDLTKYLLNPQLPRPGEGADGGRIVVRAYTAYDERNIYLAFAVNEPRLACSAGQPVRKGQATLPYRMGMPDGLEHIVNCGDVVQFAFGFRERVPGWGRESSDPWAWKGFFRDTDYHYVAHVSTEGDKLIRQWGPDTTRRNAYQCEKVPGVEEIPGGAKITRREEEKLTLYEIVLPRSELAMFDPSKGECRFGFVVCNDENVSGGRLNWGEAAGVFDYWRSSGSYGPSWNQVIPCQTFFGIER